ncbi:MAG: TIGR02217 family protein [Pseudomonadota bacterium]
MFDDVLFEPRTPLRPSVTTSFNVDKVLLSSGFENRNARTKFARKSYHVPIGQRPLAELKEILDFFCARGGSLRAFRFRDPFCTSTALFGSTITAQDVDLGSGDGSKTVFQLAQSSGHPIRRPIADSVVVAVDAVPIDPNEILVDASTGQVTFVSAPALGTMISAGCAFDTPVRFQNDILTLRQTNAGAGEIDDLLLIEVLE